MLTAMFQSPVFWTGFVTLLRTGGFFIVLPVLLRKVPTEELGMWYVFLGIAQFSGIVELGFAPNISRFASFFLGGAASPRSIGIDHSTSGHTEPNLAGIAGLAQLGRTLYPRLGAAVGVLMTLGGGIWLYIQFGAKFWNLQVAPAYFLYAAGMTASMYGYFWMNLLFGVDRVRQGQQVFATGLILNYALCLGGLLAGAGLYALALGQIALALYPRWMASRIVQKDFLSKAPSIQEVSWRDLWPMTWRSGLCTFAAWLSMPVTTLICAQITGLADTARYGLSMQLVMMVYGLAGTWMSVCWPKLAVLRTQQEQSAIRRLVAGRMGLSVATYLLGAFASWWLAPLAIHLFKSKTDFLPPALLALLFGVVLIDFLMGNFKSFLVTGNHMPHLNSTLVAGVLTVVLCFILGHYFGILGIILSIAVSQLIFNFWYTLRLCWTDLWPVLDKTIA